MRTSTLALTTAAIGLTVLAGCTVKDVDAPAFSGPSSLARTIIMTADRDTLIQNGEDEAVITLRAQVPPGESENVRLRAQILVDGVAQDFGTLSNKTPITPTTIRYRAPASPTSATQQVPQTVTIAVTPFDQGDFRGEIARQVDIRLVPQGVILPTNPNLVAAFTFTPTTPKLGDTVSFNAATSTNGGSACGTACNYAWNFGDGTTGSGIATTHQFRVAGNLQVALTVTDARGASATSVQTIVVAPGTPPTATFTFTPTPVTVNQDVFFSGEASTAVLPRTIARIEWDFGDGTTAVGATVTKRFRAVGTYTVVMTVTDDVGTVARSTQSITVTLGNPTVTLAVSGLKVNQVTQLIITATPATGSTIKEFSINWGDGTATEFSNSPTQTHVYTVAGTYNLVVTAEDSVGRRTTVTQSVNVTP